MAIAVLGACAVEEKAPVEPREVGSIVLRGPGKILAVGAQFQLYARALDFHANELPDATLRFSSSDEAIVAVDERGWIEARGPGTAEVTARADFAEASVSIEVRPRVAEIAIEPASPVLLEGESIVLLWTPLDAGGQPIEAPLEARWRSETPTVARVDDRGKLYAYEPGTARIVVVAGEGEGSTTVKVEAAAFDIALTSTFDTLEVGDSMLIQAKVFDRRGLVISRPIRWSSSDPSRAWVDEDGRVFAKSSGEIVIEARADGAAATLRLTILPRVERIELVPDETQLYVGGTTRWQALAYGTAGQILEGRRLTWLSDDPEVVAVGSASGKIEAVAEGSALVRVTSGDAEASAMVEVVGTAKIVFDGHSSTLYVEPDQTLPKLFDIVGDPVNLPVRWISNHPAVAVVNEAEEVEVRHVGWTSIVASAGGIHFSLDIVSALRFDDIQAGGDFACGLSRKARIWCWGANEYGQLGAGEAGGSSPIPKRVALPEVDFQAITAGTRHACALGADGRAFCWGDNESGELGVDTDEMTVPTPVASVPEERFKQLSAGLRHPSTAAHTCGLTLDGRTLCWGNNHLGQLGDGTTSEISPPVEPEGEVAFIQIEASAGFTCGLDEEGQVYCWGRGPLRWPNPPFYVPILESTTPLLTLPDLEGGFVRIAAGEKTACGIRADGSSFCWGDDVTNMRFSRVPLDLARIAPGSTANCGVTTEDELWCWGRDLGVVFPDAVCTHPNTDIPTSYGPAIDVTIGRTPCAEFACLLTPEGQARCWGFNRHGQAGHPSSLRIQAPGPLYPEGWVMY